MPYLRIELAKSHSGQHVCTIETPVHRAASPHSPLDGIPSSVRDSITDTVWNQSISITVGHTSPTKPHLQRVSRDVACGDYDTLQDSKDRPRSGWQSPVCQTFCQAIDGAAVSSAFPKKHFTVSPSHSNDVRELVPDPCAVLKGKACVLCKDSVGER